MPLLSDLYAQNPGAQATTAAAPAAAPTEITPAQATASTAQTAPGAAAQQAVNNSATAQNATSANASAERAVATGYTAQTQDVPGANLASNQLNQITSQDSPLMKRARQEGILSAARRGLQNSSISAGASEGAMVDRATPLAQTNAGQLQEQSLANQAAVNRASEVSTGRQTDVSTTNAGLGTQANLQNANNATDVSKTNAQLGTQTSQLNATNANDVSKTNAQLGTDTAQFNAQQQNEVAKLNAQLQTATSQGNAQEVNAIKTRLAELQTQVGMQGADINARANELTAQAENQLRQTTLTQNSELNRQYLSGQQDMDLEQIHGRFENLIAQNQAAGHLYEAYFNTIAASMSNTNMTPERAAQVVALQQTALDAGLRLIAAMNPGATPAAGTPPLTGVAPPPQIVPTPTQPTVGIQSGGGIGSRATYGANRL